MKKKKILLYALCMIIPTTIFFAMAWINGFVPFGEEMLNSYDSFTQYSGMLLEYSRLLRGTNVFYSWGAGLGFNFFGTLTYYGMSPLNLLSLFANPQNYHIFFAIMTYLRFMLLGGAMCFYLSHKDMSPLHVILFSTIYALMGYTSTYYYNYIWIDSVIMLPFVMHGLDRLLEGKNPRFYIVALAITILINYYIGYMICIFCLIWYIYKLSTIEGNKKKITKTFFTSSILAGLTGAVVIIPSFFALLTGKAVLFGRTKFWGFSRNILSFFYTLTPGSYQAGDQSYGPAMIYVTTLVVCLVIFYFFNKKFSKKEKIATLAVIVFFYLSFSFNPLNYAWQFFQKPIWWQSRFAFVFNFFTITLAARVLKEIDHTDFKTKHRILIGTLGILAILIGAYIKWQVVPDVKVYTYVYLGLSIIIFIEMLALMDKKYFFTMLVIFTFGELTLNTYNSLKNNYRNKSYLDYNYIKKEVPKLLEKLDQENENFYRLEFMDDYTSDDGLYFGFNGINYFNSVRNVAPIELMEKLGITVYDKCHIELLELDPVLLSLLNIKYIYGSGLSYLKERTDNLMENPYPLGLGFMSDSSIKDVELSEDRYFNNREDVLKALSGLNEDLYKDIPSQNFEKSTEGFFTVLSTSIETDKDYLLIPEFEGNITIDGKTSSMNNNYIVLERGARVEIEYRIASDFEEEEVFATLLDLEHYRHHVQRLSDQVMNAKTNTNFDTILEASITSKGNYDYLFTTIEYENGMKVFVDDKEVKPDIVLDALIGLPLEKGTHEIKITYIPRGLIPGAIVSTMSLVGCAIYLQRCKKVI